MSTIIKPKTSQIIESNSKTNNRKFNTASFEYYNWVLENNPVPKSSNPNNNSTQKYKNKNKNLKNSIKDNKTKG